MTRNTQMVLLATLMTSVATGALVVKHREERAIARTLAGAAIKVAAISANPFTGTIRADGLSAGAVHIGHMRLNAAPLSLISTAQAADGGDITFEEVSADIGPYNVEIPKIVVSGADLSQDAVAALFDPNGTSPLAERIAKFNAASVSSDEITLTLAAGEVSSNTIYTHFKASNIVNGKVAAVTIESTESSTDGKDKTGVSTTLGETTITNINLPANIRFLTEKAAPGEQLVPMIDSVTAKNIEVSIEDGKGDGSVIKAASLSYGPLKGRPLSVAFVDLIKMAGEQKNSSPPSPQDMAKNLPAAADVFQALEFSAEIKDISFGVADDKPGPKGKLARFAITDFGKGGIGGISYEGLSVEAMDGHVNLGAFSLKGLMFSPFLTALSEAAKTEFKDFNPRAAMPTIAQISFNGLDVDVPTDNKQGNSADGSRVKMGLGKLELNLGDYINGVPGSASSSLEHATFDLPKNGKEENIAQLLALGVDKIDASARLDLAYAEPKQEIALKELSLTGVNLGKLTINGTIGNVSKDLFNTNTNLATAAGLAAVVKSLDVKLENTGILDKIIAMQAKAQGKSPDDFKKEMMGMAAMGIPAVMGGDGAAGKVIANAVSKFIADPKNLHIIVTSKDGLGAGDMGLISNPADLLKKVDISATANE